MIKLNPVQPFNRQIIYPPGQGQFVSFAPVQKSLVVQFTQPPLIQHPIMQHNFIQQVQPTFINQRAHKSKLVSPLNQNVNKSMQNPYKQVFQQGFDAQEENKILKNYIAQMESTIKNLESQQTSKRVTGGNPSSYEKLLQTQLTENIELRQKMEKILQEIDNLRQEGLYLKKLRGSN